jgi:hypothetical protein
VELLSTYPRYFRTENGQARPVAEFISLVHDDIKNVLSSGIEKFDVVVSTSVFEHLDDVPGLTSALAGLTQPNGTQVHFVDLRDHYFKLPFEMLKFSETTWKNWLNPTSNLNRYRLRDYRRVFEQRFVDVDVRVLEREPDAFARARPGIRPEFLSGDTDHDSVTLILVVAHKPKP